MRCGGAWREREIPGRLHPSGVDRDSFISRGRAIVDQGERPACKAAAGARAHASFAARPSFAARSRASLSRGRDYSRPLAREMS